MANRIRTIDFLPEIFQTRPNELFLNATLDQLVQQPDYKKVQGFVGSKYGYGVKSTDNYLIEPTSVRNQYQLEPSVIFQKKNTSTAVDLITYPGIIDAIKTESGIRVNDNKLFNNQFYSWDSFVDLDKLINYGQYYWLPTGPESVEITTEQLLLNATYNVVSNSNLTYDFVINGLKTQTSNPELLLVRGGTYTFIVNQTSNFYIQTMPGIDGVDPSRKNFSTRDIYGLTNNGSNNAVMTFNVPFADAQDSLKYPPNLTVDLVTTMQFSDLDSKLLSTIRNIDGISDLNNKTIMFYGTDPTTLNARDNTPVNNHIFKIAYVGDPTNPVIYLTQYTELPSDTKITVSSGVQYTGKSFVKNDQAELVLLTEITASLDTLYYVDGTDSTKFGKIKIVDDIISDVININNIIGSTSYISPNGIPFTNGLKVKFTGKIFPEEFLYDTYYVEGVGSSINLLPVSQQIVTEPFGQYVDEPNDSALFDQTRFDSSVDLPVLPDYITINRNSFDKNAWSRSNCWFHVDVLKIVIQNNNISPNTTTALANPEARAKRPIIEFYSNLRLFDHGISGKQYVDYLDTSTTDAFANVNGGDINATIPYHPDGVTTKLFEGARIVFANDSDVNVRNKIFVCHIATIDNKQITSLVKASDGDIQYLDSIHIASGDNNKGYSYYFDGSIWINSQQKKTINQPPLFDLFDNNGISFGDKEYYSGSNFNGCTLFQYKFGTGISDSVLKFPISYSGIGNLSDIVFELTLNDQQFTYVQNNTSVTQDVIYGFVYSFNSNRDLTRKLGWITAVENSFQYQIFNYIFDGSQVVDMIPTFTTDIMVKNSMDTMWPTIIVYVDNNRIDPSQYIVTTTDNTTTIQLAVSLSFGIAVDVMIYSDQVSNIGYFQIPSNLDHNPFNENMTNITIGDIRGHFKSICNNVPNLVGSSFGANNYRDLGDVVKYGTRIIQNSSSIAVAAAFVRKQNTNFFNSLIFNNNEYIKFKATLVKIVDNQNFTPYDSPATMLDTSLDIITSAKTNSNSFFWSDMLPCLNPSYENSYKFRLGVNKSLFPLSKTYDFTVANYNSVLVYVSRMVDGLEIQTQLTRDVDYIVDSTSSYVEVIGQLQDQDVVIVKEYNQTYGSYVPNTPTKVGLYPKFVPTVILDDTYLTPTYVIVGHDGSYNKLYGEYNNGLLQDFRDKVLYEFELRVYNNLKVSGAFAIQPDDIRPGQFRNTNYSYDEYLSVYSTNFLNWVGLNRVNYTNQFYDSANEYTYNYGNAVSNIDNKQFTSGHWRGIFMHLYDTCNPHTRPWEMLALNTKPTWWDTRYGAVPYTSDNLLLWAELSNGFVYNDGNSYINQKRVRSGLLDIIPVDDQGNLLSPFRISNLIRSYKVSSFKNAWKVGDMSPAEYSYIKSSSYPFDLMRIYACLKPSDFFCLGLDLDVYNYNSEFDQFLVYNRLRTPPSEIQLYGGGAGLARSLVDGYAQHSYINWVVDYLQQYGLDGSSEIKDILTSLDVRLTYPVAGFTDKAQIQFFVEKGSPNSSNNTLLIPDDSYSVLLYKNEPNDIIVYSSVIVQKTSVGYKVYGNSQNKAYFLVYAPKFDNVVLPVTVGTTTVNVPVNFTTNVITVSYGTEFTTIQLLAEFLASYGNYLTSQGMLFEDIENNIEINWNQMIAEILYWYNSGWEVGSTINVNPSANVLSVDNSTTVVQSLTDNNNVILNQNLIEIPLKDLSISRIDTQFTVKALNQGDSISYFRSSLSNVEHVIVFDNYTVFNDVIFNLATGLRQQRLYVRGAKTNNWNGTLNAPGFIINQDNVEIWTANTKYVKGDIVSYKNNYYMANKELIIPSETFNNADWIKTQYNKIHKGLIANPSTRAVENDLYYDTSKSNIQNDADLLSYSLIGYRPRPYLSDANLEDVSQVNFYKSMIAEKGTNNGLNILQGIDLQNTKFTYEMNENWMIKTNEFGGILNQNFIEFTLNGSLLTGNPAIVSVIQNATVSVSQQQIPLSNLVNYSRLYNDTKILPLLTDNPTNQLPSAGYVNLNDVITYAYNLNSLTTSTIYNLYGDDYIYLADVKNQWGVYCIVSLSGISITNVINNLNGTVTLKFSSNPMLNVDDMIGILYYDDRVDGYYTILAATSATSCIVALTLNNGVTNIGNVGNSFVVKLQNMRIASGTTINQLSLPYEYGNNLVWVDSDKDNKWNVLAKTLNYEYKEFLDNIGGNETYGNSLAYIPKVGYIVCDSGASKLYIYKQNAQGFPLFSTISKSELAPYYGKVLTKNDNFFVVSSPNPALSQIFIYRIVQSPEVENIIEEQVISFPNLGVSFGDSITLSGDGELLFISIIGLSSVFVFKRDIDFTYLPSFNSNGHAVQLYEPTLPNKKYFKVKGDQTLTVTAGKRVTFFQYTQLNDTASVGEFGYDPRPVIINYVGNGTNTHFTLTAEVGTPNISQLSITINGVLKTGGTDYTLATNVITFTSAPALGDVIQVTATVYNLNDNSDPFSAIYKTATSVDPYIQKYRIYYVKITGQIDNGTNISFYPFTDQTQYTVTLDNSTYDIVTNTTKFIIDTDKMNYVLYNDLFAILTSATVPVATATTTVGEQDVPVFTYTNMLKDYVTIITSEYDSLSDSTMYHTVEYIGYSISDINTMMRTVNNTWSKCGFLSSASAGTQSDNYAISMATNYDGTKLFVGAPNANFNQFIADVGYVYIYNRLVETWEVAYDANPEELYTLILPWVPGPNSSITINGVRLLANQYVFLIPIPGTCFLLIGPHVKAGDIITLSSSNFVLDARIGSYDNISQLHSGQQFGTSITCNTTGSELIVGCPYDVNIQGSEGAVYRFTNEGKKFGRITALVAANNVLGDTYLLINGYRVNCPTGDAYDIANAINAAAITNVIAYVYDTPTGENLLRIRLRETSISSSDNKLNIGVFNGNFLYELGISPYIKTQTIREPHAQNSGRFGYRVLFNENNSFIVTAPRSTRYLNTPFDLVDSINPHNNTVFDNNLTTFEDKFTDAGAAYIYDYITPYSESLLNTGQYVYAQSVNDLRSDYGPTPGYGESISFNNNVIMVGSPNFKSNAKSKQRTYTADGSTKAFTITSGLPIYNVSVIVDSQPIVAITQVRSYVNTDSKTTRYVVNNDDTTYTIIKPNLDRIQNYPLTTGIDSAGVTVTVNTSDSSLFSDPANGSVKVLGVDYTVTSSTPNSDGTYHTTLTFINPLDNGNIVTIVENGVTSSYQVTNGSDPNNLLVTVNGTKKVPYKDYVTLGSNVLFTSAIAPGAAVVIAELNGGAYRVEPTSIVFNVAPTKGSIITISETLEKNTSGYVAENGRVTVYNNTTGINNWHTYHTPCEIVDVSKIQKVQLYNNLNDANLDSLDYFDPLNGKLLGAVRQNLDYISNSDPAGYNTGNYVFGKNTWGETQVGNTWYNTTTSKYLDYHQDDLSYNSNYWGYLFPGSVVTVYTWIQSSVTPNQYKGPGMVLANDKYVLGYVTGSNQQLSVVYYYWVRNTNTIYGDKTLTDTVLESYINDPQNSGISYFAPLTSNTYALYNSRNNINGSNTNIHIGYSSGFDTTTSHSSYQLIRTNFPEDFLPGFIDTTRGYNTPTGLYSIMLDSFAGCDEAGQVVPNFNLPKYMQIGINIRPRQGFFIDRFTALKNYILYANNVLSQYPINEFSTATFLHTQGDYYNTSNYWDNIYWWDVGYSNDTRTSVEVATYKDLFKLTVIEGFIAGVRQNSKGKREVYAYISGSWNRIGLEDGTIQISSALYDYQANMLGFGNSFFDSTPNDQYPSTETMYIIRALNEQIYVGPLLEHRNKSLTLIFEYIQSENISSHNYLPWLNKSSFLDISYTVRELAQTPNYHRDNDTLISGYVDEVKPYHSVVKNIEYKYTNIDYTETYATDFDLPALYNSVTNRFTSPKLVYNNPLAANGDVLLTDPIWQNDNYSAWIENYGLSLVDTPNTRVCLLKNYMQVTDVALYVDNARGMPVQGILHIDNEMIAYTEVNRSTGKITGLNRGVNQTIPAEHFPNMAIYMDLPALIVVDSGRGYIDPPTVTAYIDTSIYPKPKTEAVLEPIMSGDRVVGINIINPGENYPVAPTITISSSYDVTFDSTKINYLDNTIILPNQYLQTGDLIKASNDNNANSTIPDGYYYIFVVASLVDSEIVEITLHKSFSDSLFGYSGIKLTETPGVVNYTFSLSALAIPQFTNTIVRGLSTTMRFDRTSYEPKLIEWKSSAYYSSPYSVVSSSGSQAAALSYGKSLLVDSSLDILTANGSSQGTGAKFTVYNMFLGGYYDASITHAGNGYNIGDVITFTAATLYGNDIVTTSANDCVITVTGLYSVYIRQNQDSTSGTGTNASFNIIVQPISNKFTSNGSTTNYTLSVTPTDIAQLVVTVDGVVKTSGIDYTLNGAIVTFTTAPNNHAIIIIIAHVYTVTLDYFFGTDYKVNDTITFVGSRFGGVDTTNDLVITVNSVGPLGQIDKTGFTYVGNPIKTGPIKTIKVTGRPLDAGLSSLAGILLPIRFDNPVVSPPILSPHADNNGYTVVNFDYNLSGLHPGQIQGLPVYFYQGGIHYTYTDTRSGGATVEIYRPRFNPYSISNQYTIKVTNPGSIYNDSDFITIHGHLLGGVDGINDATVTFSTGYLTGNHAIAAAKVYGVGIASYKTYFVKPISSSAVQLYKDSNMKVPVDYTNDYVGSGIGFNFAYIPQPIFSGQSYIYDTSSYVVYDNRVYRCIESNNDSTFIKSKWNQISVDDVNLNALDRVIAHYSPNSNMLPKDLKQLVQGLSYPNNIYYGNSFSPEDSYPLDVVLKGQQFYPKNLSIKSILYDGVNYVAIGENTEHSTILSSIDGINYTNNSLSNTPLGVTGISYFDLYNQYMVTTNSSTNPLLISYDLENWLTVGNSITFDKIPFDDSKYDSSPITCPNGLLNGITFTQGYYYAVGDHIVKSSDGITWTVAAQFSNVTTMLYAVAQIITQSFDGLYAVGNESYVVSGAGTSAPITTNASAMYYTNDGDTWIKLDPYMSNETLYTITASDQTIVTAGTNGHIYNSNNGINWTLSTITTSCTVTLHSSAYGLGKFVIVGDNGVILTSNNGTSFIQYVIDPSVNFNSVTFDGIYFYVAGNNSVIYRSDNTTSWLDISYIGQPSTEVSKLDKQPYSVVKGTDFLFGYGPEELVAGLMTDSVSIRVNTNPGSYWDDQSLLLTANQPITYIGRTGFNMISKSVKLDHTNSISFMKMVDNPAQLSVYLVDESSLKGHRIYEGLSNSATVNSYTVDWINKTITLSNSIASDKLITIEVYEVGNGKQYSRGTSDNYPIRINLNTGFSEIQTRNSYVPVITEPICYHNGQELIYDTDYTIIYSDSIDKFATISFTQVYDPDVDFISFALLDTSIVDFNYDEYRYSIPETQVFHGTATDTFTLTNYNTGYDESLMIVEINGIRRNPSEYTLTIIDDYNATLVFGSNVLSTDIVAVTTFHELARLFASTTIINNTSTIASLTIQIPQQVDTVTYTNANPYYATKLSKAFVTINGERLSSEKYQFQPKTVMTFTGDNSTITFDLTTTTIDANVTVDGVRQVPFTDYTISSTNIIFTVAPAQDAIIEVTFGNKLVISSTINNGDQIIATTFGSGPNPNNKVFTIEIDKHSNANVYRDNDNDGTWLTSDLVLTDDIIHVHNVNIIVDKTSNMNNIIQINGEKIRFLNIDYKNNTLSGLVRGVYGTGVVKTHYKYERIYGRNKSTQLAPEYYAVEWDTSNIVGNNGDPTQISTSPAAKFLNNDRY